MKDQFIPSEPLAKIPNSPIASEPRGDADTDRADNCKICYWDNKAYSEGAVICIDGQQNSCGGGRWYPIPFTQC